MTNSVTIFPSKRDANPRIRCRPTCYNCFRPSSHCVCDLVESFEAHCDILILQHPHERRKYHGSARFVRRVIRNVTMLRQIVISEQQFKAALGSKRAVLLYPHSNAAPCEETTLDSNHLLIVLDGTWCEAQKIYYRNPFLHSLPALTFNTQRESIYRIRKQPYPHCLSTVESIAYALLATTPRGGGTNLKDSYMSLLDGFARFINAKIITKQVTIHLGAKPSAARRAHFIILLTGLTEEAPLQQPLMGVKSRLIILTSASKIKH